MLTKLRRKGLPVWVVLLALLAETFVAASHIGAMAAAGSAEPVNLADGSRIVVICTGDSIKRVRVDADGQLLGGADVDRVPADVANMCFMACMVVADIAINGTDLNAQHFVERRVQSAGFSPNGERRRSAVRFLFPQNRAPPAQV